MPVGKTSWWAEKKTEQGKTNNHQCNLNYGGHDQLGG
jgi:hypothetical protein